MTDRKMSPKGFLHKTTTKAAGSAAAFLATYREWLTTGELAPLTSPILLKMDNKEVMPTPALEEIKNVVFAHMLELDCRKSEASIEKAQTEKEPKAHVGIIYTESGVIATRLNAQGEEEELIKQFDLPQDCQRWIFRRLIEAAPRSYATMDHTKTAQQETLSRDDAFADAFKIKKGPTYKPQSKTTSKLGFGVKVSDDRASFSRG